MRLYWETAVRGYRRYATYRGATWAGVFTNTVFGFMQAYILLALYRQRTIVGGFDVRDAMTYVFLKQGMIMTVAIFGWWEIALTIRSGAVVTDLIRPYDYQLYWFAQFIGRAPYQLVFRGIPPFLIGVLAFSLRVPAHPGRWIAFMASVALAVCVSFALQFIMNLTAFWFLDYRGIHSLFLGISLFFGGFVLPITYFPGGLRAVAERLPFAAVLQVPVEVYLGKGGVAGHLAFQAAWAAGLLLAGRVVLAAATRRVVTQGG